MSSTLVSVKAAGHKRRSLAVRGAVPDVASAGWGFGVAGPEIQGRT